MSKLFVITDPALDGPTNMAIDEALLETVAAGAIPAALRFYQWTPATLSLGYFQGYHLREEHSASLRSPIVRRASGGGAIMHDHELTYSLVISREHRLAKNAESLYIAVHEALVDLLAEEYKITTRFWRDVRPTIETQNASTHAPAVKPREPFLCFERRTDGDLVTQQQHRGPSEQANERSEKNATSAKNSSSAPWFKILGSAQRRHAGAILQHGSLLLEQSAFAPELPGLKELTHKQLTAEKIAAGWLSRIAALLDLPTETADSSIVLNGSSFQKALEKFAGSEWLMARK